jgi:hypothetical protein
MGKIFEKINNYENMLKDKENEIDSLRHDLLGLKDCSNKQEQE